jgi:hypothetical protein
MPIIPIRRKMSYEAFACWKSHYSDAKDEARLVKEVNLWTVSREILADCLGMMTFPRFLDYLLIKYGLTMD